MYNHNHPQRWRIIGLTAGTAFLVMILVLAGILISGGRQHTQMYAGEDYTVTAVYTDSASLPADAVLTVQEILPGTAAYQNCVAQTLSASAGEDGAFYALSDARYFDISFLSGGQPVEPADDVQITITYADAMAVQDGQQAAGVHFAQDGIEFPATEVRADADGVHSFRFSQSSFSLTGTFVYKQFINTENDDGTHTMVAVGDEYTFSVTYGPEAEIPDNAGLSVTEIEADDALYEEYYRQTEEELTQEYYGMTTDEYAEQYPAEDTANDTTENGEETEENAAPVEINYLRLFDLEIIADGEKLEPAAPVSVTVQLNDSENMQGDVAVVHFADEGTQVITEGDVENSVDPYEEQQYLDFTLDSFSLVSITYSATTNTSGQKPQNNTDYLIYYVISDIYYYNNYRNYYTIDSYYIIDGDGNSTHVWINNNKIYADSACTDSTFESKYLWHVEKNGNTYTIQNRGTNQFLESNSSSGLASWHNETLIDSQDGGYKIHNSTYTGNGIAISDKKVTRVTSNSFTTFYFASTNAQKTEFPMDTRTTVDSRALGITLNLLDYDDESTLDISSNILDKSSGNTQTNKITQAGINSLNGSGTASGYASSANLRKYLYFLYAGTEKGNDYYNNGKTTINTYTGATSPAAVQGIVKSTLVNGFPALRGTGTSLDYLFSTTPNAYKTVYADVNHLLWQEGDYLVYDSDESYAYYGASGSSTPYTTGGNDFTVFADTYKNANGDAANPSIGFFPLNAPNTVDRNVSGNSYYNHHLGLTMSADFYIPRNGLINGNDMTFEFRGDDDMWVYVDDVLVLDIGGIHQPVSGKIDFKTGAVTIYNDINANGAVSADGTSGNVGNSNTLTALFKAAGKTWDGSDFSSHTIKVFYMERGGQFSNLRIKMNMQFYNTLTIEKQLQDTNGNTVDASTLTDTDPISADTEYSFRLYVECSDSASGSTVTIDGTKYKLYTKNCTTSDFPWMKMSGLAYSGGSIDSDGSIRVKAGQQIVFSGLPKGIKYFVEEFNQDGSVFTNTTLRRNGTDGALTNSDGNTWRSPVYTVGDNEKAIYYNILPAKLSYNLVKIDARNWDSDYIYLSGAVFDLYRLADDSETGNTTLTLADDTTVNVVKIKSGITTTGDSAGISLGNLYYGTYYLAETQAPAGYTKLSAPIKLVLDGETKNETRSYAVDYTKSGDTITAGTITVGNSQIYEMPATGGRGTAIYTVAGVLLIGAAFALCVGTGYRRRREI